MNPNELTKEQKDTILTHFRRAVASRIAQWDHELAIETILGREVSMGIEDWAVGVDDVSALTWQNFVDAIS